MNSTMKKQSRFLKSVTETAKTAEVTLPWARGSRRAAFIARRKGQEPVLKRA